MYKDGKRGEESSMVLEGIEKQLKRRMSFLEEKQTRNVSTP